VQVHEGFRGKWAGCKEDLKVYYRIFYMITEDCKFTDVSNIKRELFSQRLPAKKEN
jgi:hypothetical protein